MLTAAVGERESRKRARGVVPRVIGVILGLLVVCLSGAAIWLHWRAHICLPQVDGTVVLSGLAAPVEIFRDAQGVPHIEAQYIDDLIFAQGYVTAQDRLWQMDLSRRLARGELSEIFGKRTLELDLENRRLGFTLVAERGVAEMEPASRGVLAAYARGVNAFISSHPNRLPIEFVLLHYRPRPWRETDSIGIALNMAKSLNTSWRTDLMRARIRSKLPPQLYSDLFPDRSPLDHPVAETVPGPPRLAHPDVTGVLSVLDHFPGTSRDREFSQSVPDLSAFRSESGAARNATLDPMLLRLLDGDTEFTHGSNNWVVSGVYTRSGKPLLSNDPHLGHGIPSIWYQVDLKAPGFHTAGVSLPGGPLVVIGHNERIAWGMTNTGPDVQDIYLETLKPGDPDKYLVNGRWVDAELREERIGVRATRDVKIAVKMTRHGPVIEEQGNHALALKWTALEPHAITFPFLKMNQAQNWPQFKEAIRSFTGPMQNMVYADVEGNIGYYAPGWVPVRRHGDGSVPVPGNTDDYEWTGYIPFEDLPHAYNPPSGVIVTANSRVVPDHYPYFITHGWAAPWRTARILRLLETGSNFTVEDMLRIDMDIYSAEDAALARDLLDAGAARPPDRPEVKLALSVLRDWDGNAHADSQTTLICEVTRPIVFERILRPKLGDDASGYHWPLGWTFLDAAIRNNWTRWLPPGDEDFNVTLMKSLAEAVQRISKLVGSTNPSDWKWGETIHLTFRHPLDGFWPGNRIFDVGPFAQAGMATTVKATTANSGPSMRMVVDFSNLDNSMNNITLGASGQVFSRHYRDQFPAWYTGRSFPMLFSDAAVRRAAVHRLVLQPVK